MIVKFAKEQVSKKLFSINRICLLCGISKNTYYNSKDPKDKFSQKYDSIKKQVEKIIKDNSAYGIRRIKTELQEKYDISIGRDTLSKLLILWGLDLKRKIRKKKISMLQKILQVLSDKVNLLIRTKIINPFQAVTSDITEILYSGGKLKCYMCVHKDVFGQEVFGYEVREDMTTTLVMNSFKQACKKIKRKMSGQIPDMLWHQDQGSQYTSYEYVGSIQKVGKISYSTKGTPTENPGQESFFGRFKDENSDELLELKTFKEVKKIINKKIHYYNNERLHTSINNQTPSKFTKSFLKSYRLKLT